MNFRGFTPFSLCNCGFYYSFPLKVKLLVTHVLLFATLWTVAPQVAPSVEFSRQNIGVGCYFLLHGIFLTQGSNSGLPHCRQVLYQLNHQMYPINQIVSY